MVEPDLLALTRTPSIGPSRSEVILPLSAGGAAWAAADSADISSHATIAAAAARNAIGRFVIGLLPMGKEGTDRVAYPYSGLIWACFTTVPQRADSLRMNVPKSSGVPP